MPSQLHLPQVFTKWRKFRIFRRFYNISNFCKNCISRRGPVNFFSYWFSLTPRNLQLFTDFTIFPLFAKITFLLRGPLNPFFYRFSLTPGNLQFLANFTIFVIFAKIAILVGALSTASSAGFHWLYEIDNFSQILQYLQFLQLFQKSQFSSGPLTFSNRFSLTSQTLQFFADFSILSLFTNIEVLVGALSSPCSTGFHWLDESSNFSHISKYSQFSQTS